MYIQVMDGLSEKGRKTFEMRLEGYAQEEIADKLGYKSHSEVQKRITKIGLNYSIKKLPYVASLISDSILKTFAF